MKRRLEIGDTVLVEELRHRLALGLAFSDALSAVAAAPPLRVDIETIGAYRFPKVIGDDPLPMRFEMHGSARHALRYAGRIRKLIDRSVANGDDPAVTVRIYGPLDLDQAGCDPAREARRYVPRRLRLMPAMDGGAPAPTPANIRRCWLWPGSAYPTTDAVTAIRGRVVRGAAVDAAVPIPWPRVFATIPGNELNFNAATIVGRAHGDDRGEFLVNVERGVAPAAALGNPVTIRLWAFVRPPAAATDPKDPLDALPVEDAGTDTINDVLRGLALPASYTQQVSKPVVARLGATTGGPDTTLLVA